MSRDTVTTLLRRGKEVITEKEAEKSNRSRKINGRVIMEKVVKVVTFWMYC